MIAARVAAGAALLGLVSSDGIRLHTVEVQGDVQPATREVVGTITTEVRTPFGGVPVTGHVRTRYRCDGTFDGTLSYNAVIRLLARLRGATLVNQMEGRVESAEPWNCRTGRDRFAGRLTFADSLVVGHLAVGRDTVPVSGFAWPRGHQQFRSVLSVGHSNGGYTLHVRLEERER